MITLVIADAQRPRRTFLCNCGKYSAIGHLETARADMSEGKESLRVRTVILSALLAPAVLLAQDITIESKGGCFAPKADGGAPGR